MTSYISTEAIRQAYGYLKSGALLKTGYSALQYMLALDSFKKIYNRSCDTKNKDDEGEFIRLAHQIESIDEAEAPSYIEGFTDCRPTKSNYRSRINSNFIQGSQVKKSRDYPKLGSIGYPMKNEVLYVDNGVLDIHSIKYVNINEYLKTEKAKFAFVIWLLRYHKFEDISKQNDALRTALRENYTDELVSSLYDAEKFSENDLNFEGAAIFTSDEPHITWELLGVGACHDEAIERAKISSTASLGLSHNLIFCGAPGTGKSYQLNKSAEENFVKENVRRVTFYPDYTYTQFVGGYRPTPLLDKEGKPVVDENGNRTGEITYDFIPGPFMRTYVEAVQNPDESHLLIIEEINRANPARVFGDVFQLLDRDKNGRSVYDLSTPDDMRLYLETHIPEYHGNNQMGTTSEEKEAFLQEEIRLQEETKHLSIPPNMYIWATMNSADQGVSPMDTAFRRRWDFKYMGINDGEAANIDGTPLNEIEVPCGEGFVKWNDLRKAINKLMLSSRRKINEDKLLGPFFINPESLTEENFTQVFKDKVLMYLYEDAGKNKALFREGLNTYADICKAFDSEGMGIFDSDFDYDSVPFAKGKERLESDGSEE